MATGDVSTFRGVAGFRRVLGLRLFALIFIGALISVFAAFPPVNTSTSRQIPLSED